MNERILIVEDDHAIVRVLNRTLTYEGYNVESASDGETGFEVYKKFHPDLIILDWMLPGMDGIEFCDRIRSSEDNVPIIMLTAKDTTSDRVLGLDAGVDDYMVKPFEIEELTARIRALLRRTKNERTLTLSMADLVLDTSTRLASRGGRTISLTAKEYDLLELFLRHPRQVLTREVIFDRVWGYDFGGESNVLDVYIRYLRQKIEDKGEIRLIHTVRGVGYVMRETP
jgi:two-component system response regulator MprA